MGGFFNRMYYGNPNKPDLKKEHLEGSRIKLFFTVLQVRIWQLIQLSLLYSVFWIPVFYIYFMLLGALADQKIEVVVNEVLPTLLLLFIPCLTITGPATAGVAYVLRKWSNDEHAWVWTDFRDAIKANWKQGLAMMFINGVLAFLFYNNLRFYQALAIENDSIFFFILQYLILVLGLLYAMMNIFIYPMIVTYKLKLSQIIKNAFILTMVKLPRTILIFALVAVILFLCLSYLVGVVVLIVIGFAFIGLITASYSNWMFDKYINNRQVEEQAEGSKAE
ncbi:MAG: DUF624 domain-containing protein [Eubacteriales bacterium]|jgi:uncharacterized membrane protein YesL|nr:DUF624 domain-containing protein [Clostridia bacterium]MDI9512755.1 DUF624 domain-containing protein [Bacillota bacterium]